MLNIQIRKHPSQMTEDEKLLFKLGIKNKLNKEQIQALRLKELKDNLDKAILNYLDKIAISKGYGDGGKTPMAAINSITSYINDKNPIFASEAQVFKDYRSDVWTLCAKINSDVEKGLRPIPTEEELLAELPKINWLT
jgi:hypothetical protein